MSTRNPYIAPYTSSQLALDKQLEDRRCDLLAQIDSVISSHGSIDSLSAADLKSLYNKTVDEQWNRRSGSFPDPLVAFPEDIWQSIIAQVVDYTYGRSSENTLLRLLDVSRLWMTKLISCPVLWTTITINPREEDLLAKAAVFLYLSKQSNLNIEFISIGRRQLPKELYDMLAPHAGRMVELSFGFLEDNPFEQIVRLTQQIGHLPKLKWIRNEFTSENLNRLLQYVPYLRGVERVHLGIEDLIYPSSVLVDGICFRLYFEEKLPNIWYNYNRLRDLTLSGDYTCLLDILSGLNCPLVTLDVTKIPSKGFRAFIESISRFDHLESLSLHIQPRLQFQATTTRDVPPPILPIKSLQLAFNIYGEDTDTVAKINSDFDADITGIVEHAMPQIERLSLWEVPITSGLLSLFQSSCRLQRLTIRAHNSLLLLTEHSPLELSQLQYLRWDFNSANILRSRPLVASSVAICSFISGYYSTPTELGVTSTTLLPQGCSNSLVRLSISTGQPFQFSLKDLLALRELEFDYLTHNCWIGDILEQLIISPGICPFLHKLVFRRFYKEWDILFLVLERRNFLKDSKVSPIQEIEMPMTPPYRVLYPLTQLLGGMFPSYLSVEQYANVGFDEVSDRQICYHCRLPSDGSKMSKVTLEHISEDWDWTYNTPLVIEEPNPPLNASIKNWLASKSDRRQQIKESVERSLTRGIEFGYCGNCTTEFGPVVVTAHFFG